MSFVKKNFFLVKQKCLVNKVVGQIFFGANLGLTWGEGVRINQRGGGGLTFCHK